MDQVYSTAKDQERRVDEVLRRHVLPPYVAGYDVEFRDGWFGDPMIWVSLKLREDGHFPQAKLDEMNDLRMGVFRELFAAVPDRTPFVQFTASADASPA